MEQQKSEKEEVFEGIRRQIGELNNGISNLQKLALHNNVLLGEIPNICITLNNKIIEIQKIFENVGIDFYDLKKCKTQMVFNSWINAIITLAMGQLYCCVFLLTPTQEELETYKKAFEKPTLKEKILRKKRIPPKTIVKLENVQKAKEALKSYKEYNDMVYNFTLEKNALEGLIYLDQLSEKKLKDLLYNSLDEISEELEKVGCQDIKSSFYKYKAIYG